MNKYIVSVTVAAPTKEQAHQAVGYILRTDTTMHTLQELPCMDNVHIDWESLHAVGFEENRECHELSGELFAIQREPFMLTLINDKCGGQINVPLDDTLFKQLDLSWLGEHITIEYERNGYGKLLNTTIKKGGSDE